MTIEISREETPYSFWLAERGLLYAPPHRQDNTYHGLCYTSRGALAGTRNNSMGPPWRIDPKTMSERSYLEVQLAPAQQWIQVVSLWHTHTHTHTHTRPDCRQGNNEFQKRRQRLTNQSVDHPSLATQWYRPINQIKYSRRNTYVIYWYIPYRSLSALVA